MNTKIVKLVTQEEIICKHQYFEESGTHVLKMPCALVMTHQGFGAIPWMQCAKTEKGISISEEYVITVADPIDEIRNEYEESFGSGIVIPSADQTNSIIGTIGVD